MSHTSSGCVMATRSNSTRARVCYPFQAFLGEKSSCFPYKQACMLAAMLWDCLAMLWIWCCTSLTSLIWMSHIRACPHQTTIGNFKVAHDEIPSTPLTLFQVQHPTAVHQHEVGSGKFPLLQDFGCWRTKEVIRAAGHAYSHHTTFATEERTSLNCAASMHQKCDEWPELQWSTVHCVCTCT